MTTTFYTAKALIGGGATALDFIDGAALNDGDIAFVDDGTNFYKYHLDATSAVGEDSPEVISPDTNAGDKRWILLRDADIYVGNTTRESDAASGTQAITGVGFKGSRATIVCGMAADPMQASIGMDDGGTENNCLYNDGNLTGGGNWLPSISNSVHLVEAAGKNYTGKITTWGLDGFTFTWVRTGVTAGNTISILFIIHR